MADTKTLTMVFELDNEEQAKYALPDPKDGLTRTEVDTAMQKMIDSKAVMVKGHTASAIKEVYITTTTKTALA